LLEINLHRGQGRDKREVVEDYLNTQQLSCMLWRHCVPSNSLLSPKAGQCTPFNPW